MSDNKEKLLQDLKLYVKHNIDISTDEEGLEILENIMDLIILIEDDE